MLLFDGISSLALEVFSLTTSIDWLWKCRPKWHFRFQWWSTLYANIYHLLNFTAYEIYIRASPPSMRNIHIKMFFHMHVCIVWIRMLSFDQSKRGIRAVSLSYIYSRWPLRMSNVGPNLRAVRASWHNSIRSFLGYDEQGLDWLPKFGCLSKSSSAKAGTHTWHRREYCFVWDVVVVVVVFIVNGEVRYLPISICCKMSSLQTLNITGGNINS